MNKSLILLALLFSINLSLYAQSNALEIKGQVLEEATKQPVGFATVMLIDPVSKKTLDGTTTDESGYFVINTQATDFYLDISFIGFDTKSITEFPKGQRKINLGSIVMSQNSAVLDEVVVRGEKSQTEFKLDKRVFNVGKDLSSTGAGALDVLNNVPSVNVNIEGQISLRGSAGVQILINGKPSVLASEQGNALGTITADMIEKIEVITNPSAKYDAEGTSGIINIVLKKEERKGMNGSVSVNTGVPHNHSIGLSLNRRTENFNFFGQLGVGYRELPNDRDNINRDLVNNTEVISSGKEYRNETFYNLILGTDYHINDHNIITLSGYVAFEDEDQPSQSNFKLYNQGNLDSEWERNEVTTAGNPKYQYELQYKREFKDNKDHTLLMSALGNLFYKEQSSDFTVFNISGSQRNDNQRTETDFGEIRNTFNVDYTKPIADSWTFETGFQYVLNEVTNDFAVYDMVDDEPVAVPELTNLFEYNQNVFGGYATGAYEGEKWGLKLGLRVENTDLSTLLATTDEQNNQKFTNFFPTLHTSYKISKTFSVQAGYSRRIYRPRLWDLNPFFNIRNNFSIYTGNPNLLPEYTDSYEISSVLTLGEASLNASIYRQYTTEVIERVSIFENNINTTSPYNIGTNQTTGLEFNGKYSVNKKLSFNGDFNFNFFNRRGSFNEQVFDFDGNRWSTKITGKLKLPFKTDIEVTGRYQSGFETVQGRVADVLFADFGARKKILNGKGVISLSVRDIFASRIRESEAIQESFYTFSRRLRGRFITLGFSYGFGKGEAMEYSGSRRYR